MVHTIGAVTEKCTCTTPFHKDVIIEREEPDFVAHALLEIIDYIPSDYIDSDVKTLLTQLIIPKCDAISIEYPYYDSDFNSTYYRYHVKKFRQCRKECCRLVLYRNYCDIIEGKQLQRCIGYISLRPISNGHKIGRSFLDPTVFFAENGYIICGKYKVHYEGEEELVQAMPYMQQEGDIAVCAHVCLWSAIRFFSSRFPSCANLTMGEIVDRIMSPQERKIPSPGLTSSQISALFLNSGFSSIILKRDESNEQVAKLSEQLLAYIDSGIPVICVSQMLKHAVIACGRTAVDRGLLKALVDGKADELVDFCESIFTETNDHQLVSKRVDVIMESSLIQGIVVNDDNEMPYNTVKKSVTGPINRSSPRLVSTSQIDFCVIPLYKRMLLSYSAAKDLVLRLYDRASGDTTHEWHINARDDVICKKIIKLSLVSANTFKEWIYEAIEHYDLDNAFLALCQIAYPRFLWLAEISTIDEYSVDKCSGFIVLDSTCSASDSHVCVAIADNKKCTFFSSEYVSGGVPTEPKQKHIFYEQKFNIPLFRKNYIEVKENGKRD